jgi:hypothetical protein
MAQPSSTAISTLLLSWPSQLFISHGPGHLWSYPVHPDAQLSTLEPVSFVSYLSVKPVFLPCSGAAAVSPSPSLSEAIFRLAPGHFQQERERQRVREPSVSLSSALPRPSPPPALAYGCLGGGGRGKRCAAHVCLLWCDVCVFCNSARISSRPSLFVHTAVTLAAKV